MKTLKRKEIKAYKETRLREKGKTCPITYVQLEPANSVLDHDHTDGYCREVIDRNLNQFIGKLESNYKRFLGYKKGMLSLPLILDGVAQYLRTSYVDNPLHPSWVDLQIRKFGRKNKDAQEYELRNLGAIPKKTSRERTKQFHELMYK